MAELSLAERQAEMRKRMSAKNPGPAKTENFSNPSSSRGKPPDQSSDLNSSSNVSASPVKRSFEELVKCIERREGSAQTLIGRKDLYDLVWVAPLVNIAKHFGISDVGLAKACRNHRIPLPGRGYWAKVEAGQRMLRSALPQTGESWIDRLTFNGNFKPVNEIEVSEIPEVREELLTANKIAVPEVPSEWHPLVIRAQRDLVRSKPKVDGLLSPSPGVLDLHVSPAQLPRAFVIANALVFALEARGYSVSILKRESEQAAPAYWDRFAKWVPGTNASISIIDEHFGFSISELADKVPHAPTREEQRRIDRGDRYGIPVYDHPPSGKLCLALNMPDLGLRGSWSDGKQQRVESCLNNFVVTLIKASHAIKIARAKEQREREERDAEEKRRREYQEWRYEEDKRVRRLDEQITAWKRAEEVRAYAASVEEGLVKTHGGVDETSEVGKWLAWIRDYARRLDPSRRDDIGRDRRYW